MMKCIYKKSSCTTSKICNFFSNLWINLIHNKRCNCSGCIKFSIIFLQTFQQSFINIIKSMSFVIIRKINFIKYVKKLSKKNPVFHKIRRFPHELPHNKGCPVRFCKKVYIFPLFILNSIA